MNSRPAKARDRDDTDPRRTWSVRLERALFGHRAWVLAAFALVSLFLGWRAAHLALEASYQKMVPLTHPFVANSLKYESELRPLENVVRISVENTRGDLFDAAFLDRLKRITDEVFYIPGVDRGNLKSLWTPNVFWLEVTEDGLDVGPIIPKGYDGSPDSLSQVRANVLRSGGVGSLVSDDLRSAMITVPLQEVDPQTGAKLDYGGFARALDERVRRRFQADGIEVHVTGFAQVVGDLIEGAATVATFFGATVLLAAGLLLAYSRCWRSTLATIACCLLAVTWQLGIVQALGYGLDPYSILVPFLTFAIGVSHAVQNINTMAAARLAGHDDADAARVTFRTLFVAGAVALLCDAVGFATLLVIRIGVIQELAVSASVGVAVVLCTKMFLLPVLMSMMGVSPAAVRAQAKRAAGAHPVARALSRVTEPRVAMAVAALALVGTVGAWVVGRGLHVGDLDPGAPELRADSRYNRDVAHMTAHYATSPDVFVVMARTASGECGAYPTAAAVDRLQAQLENVPGVAATTSLFSAMKQVIASTNGGDLKWYALSRDRYVSNSATKSVPRELYNADCSMVPVIASLTDHKAETLDRVVAAATAGATQGSDSATTFLLAAGSAGIEAATNIVVRESEPRMLALVYGVVAILVLLEFRSWRVALAVMLPLYATSLLCEAIMATLGLGVKVATLPVIALGVGIGVDYGIYIWNRIDAGLRRGLDLRAATFECLCTTGMAVALTGLTLALGVFTWVFSSLKFHADMGLLLTFMFLWNMVGAVVLLPALAALFRAAPSSSQEIPS